MVVWMGIASVHNAPLDVTSASPFEEDRYVPCFKASDWRSDDAEDAICFILLLINASLSATSAARRMQA